MKNCLHQNLTDGGRIAGALSPYAGVAGLGLGGMMAYSGVIQNPIFYLILLGGGYETFQRLTNRANVPRNYYNITTLQRATLTGGYAGLLGALFVAMAANKEFQKPPEQLQLEKSWDARY